MIKQVGLILAAVGCVFLIIPLVWMSIGALSLILPLILLVIVLSYSGFEIKRLYERKESNLGRNFLLALILAVVFSFVILYLIFPYVTPQLLI
jgi:hypothetical protein